MSKEFGTRKIAMFLAVLTTALASLIVVLEMDVIWPLG